jgi:hypothetical protein
MPDSKSFPVIFFPQSAQAVLSLGTSGLVPAMMEVAPGQPNLAARPVRVDHLVMLL